MSNNLLPARFYGTIFYVKFSKTDKKSNDAVDALLITSKESYFILSADWKQSFAKVSISKVASTEKTHDGIHIIYKDSGKVQNIFLESVKLDKLYSAITVETSANPLPLLYNSLSTIIPTLQLTKKSEIDDFYHGLERVFNGFYSSFECAKPYQVTFTDLLTVFFRFRFPTESATSCDSFVDMMLKELNRQFVEEWLKSICSAGEFDSAQANGFEYALRLVINLANDLYTHKNLLEDNADELFVACAEMHERKDASKLTPACKDLLVHIKQLNDADYKTIPAQNPVICTLAKRMLMLAFCGNMVQILALDIERITAHFIDFANSLYRNMNIEETLHQLRKSVDSFSHELIKFMDTRRYDPSFRYVYACSVIAKEIVKMKII